MAVAAVVCGVVHFRPAGAGVDTVVVVVSAALRVCASSGTLSAGLGREVPLGP